MLPILLYDINKDICSIVNCYINLNERPHASIISMVPKEWYWWSILEELTLLHGLSFVWRFPQLPITRVLVSLHVRRCLFKAVSWGSDVCTDLQLIVCKCVFPNPMPFRREDSCLGIDIQLI